MKKLFAIAFMSSLVVASCAKKETTTESNVMLEEPEVTVIDTVKTTTPVTTTPAPAMPADSAKAN